MPPDIEKMLTPQHAAKTELRHYFCQGEQIGR